MKFYTANLIFLDSTMSYNGSWDAWKFDGKTFTFIWNTKPGSPDAKLCIDASDIHKYLAKSEHLRYNILPALYESGWVKLNFPTREESKDN